MLPFLFEHEELYYFLKPIPLDEVVDSVSSVLGELHKENHGNYLSLCNQCDRDESRTDTFIRPDINEAKRAGKMHQEQTKMIYELTRPIYARMNELRQQEIESNIDHGRMKKLYSEYEACCGEPSHHEYLRFTLTFSSARTDFPQSIATLWVLFKIFSIQGVQKR